MTNKEKDGIRKLYLANPALFKKIVLSDKQHVLFDMIKKRKNGITTTQLRRKMNIDSPIAAGILLRLYNKGYLDREEQKKVTGGFQYIYKVKQTL